MDIPMEIWCREISLYDYDIWRALRCLNRQFQREIDAVDITRRFDYIYVGRITDFDKIDKMRRLFRRLTVVYTKTRDVYIYINGALTRSVGYCPGSEFYKIHAISRYSCDNHTQKLNEYIGLDWEGKISLYDRKKKIGYKYLHETLHVVSGKLTRMDEDSDEVEWTLPHHKANFQIVDKFFIYDPSVM